MDLGAEVPPVDDDGHFFDAGQEVPIPNEGGERVQRGHIGDHELLRTQAAQQGTGACDGVVRESATVIDAAE